MGRLICFIFHAPGTWKLFSNCGREAISGSRNSLSKDTVEGNNMVDLGVLHGKKYHDNIKQRTVNFSYKGPDSTYFRLCSP